ARHDRRDRRRGGELGETLALAPDLPRSAPVVGAAEAVAELVRAVAESEVKGMGSAALLRTLTALDESARLVELARSEVLAEADRTGACVARLPADRLPADESDAGSPRPRPGPRRTAPARPRSGGDHRLAREPSVPQAACQPRRPPP